jgi:hypothetical protein
LVAPVPPIRLDQVGREDLAGVEGDDRDLLLVDDGEDPPAGEGRADLEVVQAAGPPQGDGAPAVSDLSRVTYVLESDTSSPAKPQHLGHSLH